MTLTLHQFDFDFPRELIAREPLPRGKANMLVVPREGDDLTWEQKKAAHLIEFLQPGDALVLNDTKVIPARLRGSVSTGASAEVLLLESDGGGDPTWEAMFRSSNPCRPGSRLSFEGMEAIVLEPREEGRHKRLAFQADWDHFYRMLHKIGEIPLPPYIKREVRPEDARNYQSVFAERDGSVAAPTASLHLSREAMAAIEAKGVKIIKLTLHVSYGTFSPVKSEKIPGHVMHAEWYSISEEAAGKLNGVRANGGKIFAVGTTAARVLETVADASGRFAGKTGWTDIFIYPGYRWKGVDGLLTNFHWPKSTLFMLVCSLLGVDKAHRVYRFAVENRYRLFSYGDCVLIL